MAKKHQIEQILSKKRIYFAIFICLSIVGFLYWREFTGEKTAVTDLSWTGKSFLYLLLGLVFMTLRDFAYMVRIRMLTKNQLSWKQSFNIIMLWEFASAVTPGVVGGSAVALFLLEKEKIALGKSTALVIITLIFDNLFYLLFIPLVFIIIDINAILPTAVTDLTNSGFGLFWIAYSIIAAVTLILLLSVFYSPKIITAIVNVIYKLPYLNRRKNKAVIFTKDIEIAATAIKNYPFAFWIKIFGITSLSWVSRFMVLNCVLFAFIELGLIEHFVALARQLIMWLAMLVTPTPGGSGMAEYAFTALFADWTKTIGISAVSLALIWRSISYYPYLIIGAILLPNWLKKK